MEGPGLRRSQRRVEANAAAAAAASTEEDDDDDNMLSSRASHPHKRTLPQNKGHANDDDDDDDDDDLLGEGAFSSKRSDTNRSNKNGGQDKMIDYLDECIRLEEERAQRRQRLQAMIQQDNQAPPAQCSKQEHGEEKEEATFKNETDKAAVVSTPVSASKMVGKTCYNINSPSYWEHVKQAAGESGSGKKKKMGMAEWSRRMDDVVEGLDFSDDEDKNDDKKKDAAEVSFYLAVAEGQRRRWGIPNADATKLSVEERLRKRRLEEAHVASTHLSSHLGTRQTLGFAHKAPPNKEALSTFSSLAQALERLQDLVRQWDKELQQQQQQASSSTATRSRRLSSSSSSSAAAAAASSSLRGRSSPSWLVRLKAALADKDDLFPLLLQQGNLLETASEEDDADVPLELLQWLWTMACCFPFYSPVSCAKKPRRGHAAEGPLMLSGSCMTCAEGARKTLEHYWHQQRQRPSKRRRTLRPPQGLVEFLVYSPVGLYCPTDSAGNVKAETEEERPALAPTLLQVLQLWAAAVECSGNDVWKGESRSGEATATTTPTTLQEYAECLVDKKHVSVDTHARFSLVALARLLLDPLLHDGMSQVRNAALGVTHNILSALESNMDGDPSWMSQTVHVLLEDCQSVASTIPQNRDKDNNDDEKDVHGWLSLALLVRTFVRGTLEHTTMTTRGPWLTAARFGVALAMRAVQRCLGDNTDMDTVVRNDKEETTAWRAMERARDAMQSLSTEDHPAPAIRAHGARFLATVELIFLCWEAGAVLAHWKNQQEAPFVLLESLEASCTELKKRVTSVFVNPHMRRVKELLMTLAVHFRHGKMVGVSHEEEGGVAATQTTLHRLWRAPSETAAPALAN